MRAYSVTDIGEKRKINQDYVYCCTEAVGKLPNLFIVADGMGGHNAGDFASRFCVEEFIKQLDLIESETPITLIEKILYETNRKLITKAKEEINLDGMGTTFVIATIFDDIMYVANVGDSRLYVIHEDMKQITEDHSLVEAMVKTGEINRQEARVHPNKNIITRALGAGDDVKADFFEVKLKKGDTVLMCSDGLTNMIEDEVIKTIIKEHNSNIEKAAETLIKKANENGGKDNIAIVLIQC